MRWLRFKQNAIVVLRERTPRYQCGQPDVLGVTCGRYMTEIEIKRTVADFRADAKKLHRCKRDIWIKSMPRQFYYLCTDAIMDRVKDGLPEWAGLLVAHDDRYVPDLSVLKRAPVNKESRRLSVKECVKLAQLMGNHLLSAETSLDSLVCNWRGRNHEPLYPMEFEI